jgi:hypothetical protein
MVVDKNIPGVFPDPAEVTPRTPRILASSRLDLPLSSPVRPPI